MKRPFAYAVVCGLALMAPLGCGDESKTQTKTTTSTPGGSTTTTHTDTTKTTGNNPPPAKP